MNPNLDQSENSECLILGTWEACLLRKEKVFQLEVKDLKMKLLIEIKGNHHNKNMSNFRK